MVDTPVDRPARAEVTEVAGGRLARAWYYEASEGLRQIPTTLLLWSAGAIVIAVVELRTPWLLWAALALLTVVQLMASLLPWDSWPPQARYVLPLLQIVAVGMMDIGAGVLISAMDVLLLLPFLGLALRPGLVPLVLGLLASGLVLVAPVAVGVERIHPLVHLVLTLGVLSAVGIRVHATVELIRLQAASLAMAREEIATRARQLQASRDTLRSIMRAATEQAVMGTDHDGVVLSVSAGAQRMFARSEQELIGMHITDLLALVPSDDHTDAGGLSEILREVDAGGAYVAELEDREPEGALRHLECVVTLRPRLEETHADLPPGYLFVVTDVSSRWEDERRQDEFISLVSHELRTPLASILGYIDLLRLGDQDTIEEQQEYIDVLERNAHRLRILVDDLLTSAQLAFGAPLSGTQTDVVNAVKEVVQGHLPDARAAGVHIEVTGDPQVLLVTDPNRLSQVVDNLVSNAVKYSLDGGHVTVSVTAATLGENSTRGATPSAPGGEDAPAGPSTRAARIRVTDDGVGISPDEQSKITERFYRARDSRRRRVRGIGLGLALVQAITEEHGGTLTITSELGAGTQVEVVLPDLPVTASAPTHAPERPTAPGTSGTEE